MAWIASLLLVSGAIFMLLGAVGLVRYSDVYLRMQATSKASTLGVALVMAGVACDAGSAETAAKSLLVVLFIFVTSPVAAYVIARTAYFKGTPLWEGSIRDDLRERRERMRRDENKES